MKNKLYELSLSDLKVLGDEARHIMTEQNILRSSNQQYDEQLRNDSDNLSVNVNREIKRRISFYL